MVTWPERLLQLSLVSSRVLSVLVFALSLFLIAQKLMSRRWETYKARRRVALDALLKGYLEEEDRQDRLNLEILRWTDRIVLREMLLERSQSATGILQRRIEELYDLTGLAAADIRTLARSWLWWHRAAAAHRLGQIALKRAKGHLIRALRDSHTEVRLEATWALGHMKMADSLPLIMQSMAHYFKIAALRMDAFIFEIGSPALPMLLDLCQNAEPETRLLAIHLVGEFKNPMALPILMALLQSSNSEERLAACKALGSIGVSEGLAAIVPCLKDPFWPLRAQAAKQLGRRAYHAAIPELTLGLEDREWWVRYNSGEALAAMGIFGKYALFHALQSQDRFARDMATQWLDELEAAIS